MDPSSLAIGVVSLIGLAIQAGVAIDKFVANWKDAPPEVMTFIEELKSLENTLQATERALKHESIYERVHESLHSGLLSQMGTNAADTNGALARCRTELHALLDALNIDLRVSKGKGWRRIVIALRAKRLRESMKTLNRHCSQLDSKVALTTLEVAMTNRLELIKIRKELQKWHEEADYQDILCWLSRLNYEDKHRQSLQQHHSGTGEWLFLKEEFMDWQNGLQQSEEGAPVPSTLWLYGDPGAGKTIETSYVIDHLRKLFGRKIQDVAIAYVYCEHQNRLSQTTSNLMSMLAKQVVLQFGRMPKALLTSYRNHANGANALSLNGYCELLSELLRSFRRSFLIVDALDEYIDEEDIGFSTSPRLLEELKKILISCQSNCRLFLTSRSDRLAMSQAMAATRIEIRADEDDIRSYLSCKVHDPNFSHANLVNEHPGLAQDIVEALTKKAEGQFLLPTLHLNNLGSTISLRKLKEQLSVLPARLNEKYGTDLARILEQPLIKREFAIRIIGWVLHAAEPLSIQGLQHALAVEQGDEYFNADGKFRLELLLETTAGLLTVKETKDKEIFPKAEQDLAETCVSYLSLKDFTEPCKPEVLDKRCQDFPFLRYASMHWGRHVTRCSHLSTATSKKIQEFIQPESMPLGSLQVIATKVLHLLHPDRIRIWKNPTLHMAIICGLDRIVEELVNDERVDLEAKGHKDENALHLAARSASQRSAELLIRHKANVNATNYSGKTALDVIMFAPYLDTLDKLFHQGHDGARIMYTLLEEVKIRKCGKPATTENMHHSRSDNPDDIMVEFHLASDKKTLAKLFSIPGREQSRAKLALTQYLLEANLEMDILDEQESIAKMLIETGVDVNSQNSAEATSLQLAAIYGRIDIVRSLLDHGANPFLKRELGCTALALAEKRGHADIVHVLLKRMETLALAEEHVVEEAEMLRHPGPRQAKHLEERAMEPETRWCRVQRFLKMMPPALNRSTRPPAPIVFTRSLRPDSMLKKEPYLEQSKQQTDASGSM